MKDFAEALADLRKANPDVADRGAHRRETMLGCDEAKKAAQDYGRILDAGFLTDDEKISAERSLGHADRLILIELHKIKTTLQAGFQALLEAQRTAFELQREAHSRQIEANRRQSAHRAQ